MMMGISKRAAGFALAFFLLISAGSACAAQIAIYNPALEGGGATGITAIRNTLEDEGWLVSEISRLSLENLLEHGVVIIPNTRSLGRNEDPRFLDNLRAYVAEAGGALIFCHDAIGAERSPFGRIPLFPEILVPGSVERSEYEEGRRAEGHSARVAVEQQPDEADVGFNYLPGYELNQVVRHMYYDHFAFTQAEGTPLLINIDTGKTVVGVGEAGKGLVVFNGMLGADPVTAAAGRLTGIDRDVMVSTVRWALEEGGPVAADASLVEVARWRPDLPGEDAEAENRVAVIGMPTFSIRERAREKINWIAENDFIPFTFLDFRDLTPEDYGLIIVFAPTQWEENQVQPAQYEKISRYIDSGGKALIFLGSTTARGGKTEKYFLERIGSESKGHTGRANPDILRSLRWKGADGAHYETSEAIPPITLTIIAGPAADGAETAGHWYDYRRERKHIAMVRAPFGYVLNVNPYHDHREFTAPAMAETAPELGPAIFSRMLAKYECVKERVDAAELSRDGRRKQAGALRLERAAKQAARTGDFPSAARLLLKAEHEMVKAYAVSMPSPAGEMRKIFTHTRIWSGFVPPPEIYVPRIAGAGFKGINAVTLERTYPSRYMEDIMPETDRMRHWADACREHGIKMGAEIMPFLVYGGSDTFDRAAAEDWRVVVAGMYGREREPVDENVWRIEVCRSRPEVTALAVNRAAEIMENYPVDHISLDYIRWSDTCYCDACREQFEKHTGITVENWPNDVMDRHMDEFNLWRAEPVTAVVRGISEHRDRINPDITLGVFTFRGQRESAGKGQFWWEWTDYVDYIHPMSYGPDNERLEELFKEINSFIPDGSRARLMPALAPPGDKRGSNLTKLQQLDLQRKYAPAGVMYFSYDLMSDYWLELLSMGPWRNR